MQFRIGNYKIIVCRTKWHTKEYYRTYFKRKRAKGICTQCNSKTSINPHRKKPYRKCDKHRAIEAKQALIRYHERT